MFFVWATFKIQAKKAIVKARSDPELFGGLLSRVRSRAGGTYNNRDELTDLVVKTRRSKDTFRDRGIELINEAAWIRMQSKVGIPPREAKKSFACMLLAGSGWDTAVENGEQVLVDRAPTRIVERDTVGVENSAKERVSLGRRAIEDALRGNEPLQSDGSVPTRLGWVSAPLGQLVDEGEVDNDDEDEEEEEEEEEGEAGGEEGGEEESAREVDPEEDDSDIAEDIPDAAPAEAPVPPQRRVLPWAALATPATPVKPDPLPDGSVRRHRVRQKGPPEASRGDVKQAEGPPPSAKPPGSGSKAAKKAERVTDDEYDEAEAVLQSFSGELDDPHDVWTAVTAIHTICIYEAEQFTEVPNISKSKLHFYL